MMKQQKENVEEEKGFKSSSPTPSAAVVVFGPSCGNITMAPLIHKVASVSIAATTTSKKTKKKTPIPLPQPYRKVVVPERLMSSARICKYCGLKLKFWTESDGSFKVFNGIKTTSVAPNSSLVEYYCGGCGDGYVFEKPKG